MNSSFLYHAFGVKEYHYCATAYKDSAIFLKLKTNVPKKCKCPHCGCKHVIKYGAIHRDIHNLPIGSKQTFLSLTVQRYQCKEAGRWSRLTFHSPTAASATPIASPAMYLTCCVLV